MRVCAVNGTSDRVRIVDRFEPEHVDGQLHDRAAFGRLVGERGGHRGLAEIALVDIVDRDELGRLARPVGDRAGLVEQERRDVAGRFDGAP